MVMVEVDLMIADDRRGVSQVFKNDGSASFDEVSNQEPQERRLGDGCGCG